MQREGPRLERVKHMQAEERLKESVLSGKGDYPGKEEDLALIRRKHKELSRKQLRRVVEGGGGLS